MIQRRPDADFFGQPRQRHQLLKIGMPESDSDLFLRGHLHDFFYFGEHIAVLADQPYPAFFRMAGAAPETERCKSWKPDHSEVRILKRHADILRIHAVAHPGAAVDLDSMPQFSLLDQIIDVTLSQISCVAAYIPVVFEGERAHPRLGGFNRDPDHVLRAMDEIGIGVDVT